MDFGFAYYFKGSESLQQTLWPGSPSYMAPELYEQKDYDYNVDVWALGVTLFACISGELPFVKLENQRSPIR